MTWLSRLVLFVERVTCDYFWASTKMSGACACMYAPFTKNNCQQTIFPVFGICFDLEGMVRGNDGVWRCSGPREWEGQYYLYEVRAYHPATRMVETMYTPDPYSRACAADAGRALIGVFPPTVSA